MPFGCENAPAVRGNHERYWLATRGVGVGRVADARMVVFGAYSMNGHDHDRARAALYSIPPDLPHSDWVRAGMAAHAAGLGFDDFDAWSAGGDSYDKRVARSTWHSFKHGKGITEGTLFHMAQEHGGHAFKPKAPAAIQHRAVKPSRRTLSAVEVWQRCEPATDSHAYIKSKNGRTDGLRVVPVDDPLRVSGSSVAGWLVVPVIPLAGGEPSSLQFIPSPAMAQQLKAQKRPTKQNLAGATMNGAFVVGELLAGGTAYVCEGIGQAWACWQATGRAGVV